MRGETTTIERPPSSTLVCSMEEWAFDLNRHICSLSQLARKRNLSAARGNRFSAIWLCTTAYHPSAYNLFPRVTTLLGTQPLSLPYIAICYLISGLMEAVMWMEECRYIYVTIPALTYEAMSYPFTRRTGDYNFVLY